MKVKANGIDIEVEDTGAGNGAKRPVGVVERLLALMFPFLLAHR